MVNFNLFCISGIAYNATLKTTHLNERLIVQILHDYKIHNAEVLVREDAVR